MDSNVVFLLIGAAIVLGLIAVLIDRLNFPQKRFRPKAVAVDHLGRAARDRTGAHIIDLDPDDEPVDAADAAEPTTDAAEPTTDEDAEQPAHVDDDH